MQTPCKLHLAIFLANLDKKAKDHFKLLSSGDLQTKEVAVCLRCSLWLILWTIKQQQVAVHHLNVLLMPLGRKNGNQWRARHCYWIPSCLAAFQCQIFPFMEVEKTSKSNQEELVLEQFYGCLKKSIKGACQQIVDGDLALARHYDVVEKQSQEGVEKVLKPMFCGKDPSSTFVAGVHITIKMLT